jgi:putative membrane protein
MMNLFNACRTGGLDRFYDRFGPMGRFGRIGYMHPAMWLIGLLITAIVIVGIVLLVRALHRSSRRNGTGAAPAAHDAKSPADQGSNDPGQAVKILDERLARGEIEIEEYRSRKDELLRK